MTEQPSTLYAKLLGETAAISWLELQPFFARGALLLVDGRQDLIAVAEALAQNEQHKVAAWRYRHHYQRGKMDDIPLQRFSYPALDSDQLR